MTTIFFFYGLSFILMGACIFAMRRRGDLLDLSEDMWLIGMFGIVHGAYAWIDLCIRRGAPFDVQALRIIGALLLPASFVFLLLFGVRIISREKPGIGWLKVLAVASPLAWLAASILGGGFAIAGIAARYFICIPGALLTASALYIRFSSSREKPLPGIVSLSARTCIFTFVIYGFVSGLVVPEADFLFSSTVNYQAFIRFFGAPVQFFMMACAIILAAGFFGMAGLFYSEKGRVKLRGGIRGRITLLICSISVGFAVVGAGLRYWWGLGLLRSTVGKDYVEMAHIMASSIAEMLNEEIGDIRTHLGSPVWERAVIEQNERYGDLREDDARRRLMSMDRKWIDASEGDPLVKQYLGNLMSLRLKRLAEKEENIGEIFLTDRFGGLVASSGKTSDFYQADEEWWRAAFDGGKGKVYIGDVEFDESAGMLSIPIAVPMVDDAGAVIGVCKVVVSVTSLFKPLARFSVGRTGRAILVDERGVILFCRGVTPMSRRLFGEAEFGMIKESRGKWFIMNGPGGDKAIFAHAVINQPALLDGGRSWRVFIEQDVKEAFAPLDTLALQSVLVACVLVLLVIPAGVIFGGMFVRPIKKIHEAAERVGRGDLDYVVEVTTRDELEELSEAFGEMARKLKNYYADMEREVGERTAELNEKTADLERTRKALVYMLDDMNELNEKLKELYAIKSDFTSMVSHELRTPLTAIKEGINIVLDGTAGEIKEEQQEVLGLAKRNVDRLSRLINDVLDFSKLEAGKLEFKMEESDMNEVVSEVVEVHKPVARERGLTLEAVTDTSLPGSIFDRDRITQVLTNLVSNAMKFTAQGGITISTGKRKGSIIVCVEDTGEGMQGEDMEKLFRKFEQLSRGKGRRTGGTGLGLAISKQIIEHHRGKIWAESEPGKGSRFFFAIPVSSGKPDDV